MRELRIQLHRLDQASLLKLQEKTKHLSTSKQVEKNSHTSYQCRICESNYNACSALKKHVANKVHQKQKTHKCQYCSKTFFAKNKWSEHERTHTGDKPYSCLQCHKTFMTGWMRTEHSRRVHDKQLNYKCSYCDKSFFRHADLRTHERVHTGEKPYDCSYCDSSFKSSASRNAHIHGHLGEKPYLCTYCSKGFRTPNNKRKHEEIHTGNGRKCFTCKVCFKIFESLSKLKTHVHFIHDQGKSYKCVYCFKSFPDATSKFEHQQSHVEKFMQLARDNKYTCKVCNNAKEFITKCGFLKHIKHFHYNLKQFHCSHCSSSFATKTHCDVHERSHTGAKPFKCEYCFKRFTGSVSLNVHVRGHTGEKPYECSYCDNKYPSSKLMNSHIRYKHLKSSVETKHVN